MKAFVDNAQRYAKMRAHTATHLLHAELAKIFPTTKQAGSFVDEDYLRFDYAAERSLTQKEILQIENTVNGYIHNAYVVTTTETSLAEATKLWAKAFFEDKYGETVRLVQVQWEGNNKDKKEIISIELCWWTHVENTKDIWSFVIVSQEAVASWIKRITAVTWPKVVDRMHEVQGILDTVVEKLWIKTATQLVDKLEKTIKEYDEMKENSEMLETTMIKNILTWNDFSSGKDIDKIFILPPELNFKNIVFQAKWLCKGQNILIYTKEGNFVLLADKWESAKVVAERLGITWWWTDTMVQGRDEKVVTLFT